MPIVHYEKIASTCKIVLNDYVRHKKNAEKTYMWFKNEFKFENFINPANIIKICPPAFF